MTGTPFVRFICSCSFLLWSCLLQSTETSCWEDHTYHEKWPFAVGDTASRYYDCQWDSTCHIRPHPQWWSAGCSRQYRLNCHVSAFSQPASSYLASRPVLLIRHFRHVLFWSAKWFGRASVFTPPYILTFLFKSYSSKIASSFSEIIPQSLCTRHGAQMALES
jgi:hypothetical protein